MNVLLRQSTHKLHRCKGCIGATRHSSQESSTTSTTTTAFDFRVSRLGLIPKFVQPSLDTITQLPEVQNVVNILAGNAKSVATTTQSDLERATQVLESIQEAGDEHVAVVALRAELLQRQGQHDRALQALTELKTLFPQKTRSNMQTRTVDLQLATAKTMWYAGQFQTVEECCEELLEDDHIQEMPLHYASALTGYGLAKMGNCNTLDDAFVVRDPCRMALKHLEQQQQQHRHSLALVASHLNLGVAEVMYGNVVGMERGLNVPMDPALRTWTQGMTLLEGLPSRSSTTERIVSALEARIEANLAWGILKVDDDEDDIIPEASEHAGKAVKVLDKIVDVDNNDKEYLRRVLTILASCYHKAGKAVTAEGLLQSATSLPRIGCTLTKLDVQSALQGYSNLCQDWDKREGDANKFAAKAAELEATLPEAWQGKASIMSSLWFWTPDEFSY